jgi:GTP-binding protein
MIKNINYMFTTHDIDLMPQDNIPEIAIVGRSNVGKSTLINALTNNKKMAHVSSRPGKTRAISLFNVNDK